MAGPGAERLLRLDGLVFVFFRRTTLHTDGASENGLLRFYCRIRMGMGGCVSSRIERDEIDALVDWGFDERAGRSLDPTASLWWKVDFEEDVSSRVSKLHPAACCCVLQNSTLGRANAHFTKAPGLERSTFRRHSWRISCVSKTEIIPGWW